MIQKTKRKALRDLLLICALLAAALLSLWIVRATAKEGTRVAVIVDNVTVAEYPLSVDCEYSLLGGKNVLAVKDGAAYMKESLCPNHDCEKKGRIFRVRERIVCLPHKLTVKVV